MSRQIFLNLPVADLARSVAFFEALGFTRKPEFSDDTGAGLVISDTIWLMLTTHARFKTFTPKEVCDTSRAVEVLISLSCDSKAEVDALVAKALAAGGSTYDQPEDLGFMYSHSFVDLDGHGWGSCTCRARRREPARNTTMHGPVHIGLIGDRDDSVPAHRAIPMALGHAAQAHGLGLELAWVPTEEITSPQRLGGFDGLWCVPASPYRSMDGALRGIRHARESGTPFLGTCGGFQHAVVEYARHVLGWTDADHGETASDATRWVIAPLACALVDTTNLVELTPAAAWPLPMARAKSPRATAAVMG
jgi:predicted lactoylglutathione lyase